ncbi:MAG: alpha-L-arabinofuranosidase C-terminal domain-containing protein, partial [Candidatus Bathyarchaeia archaeon]
PRRRLEPLRALDASASISRDGQQLILTLVNQSLDEDLDVEISLDGNREVYDGLLMILNASDVRAYNDFDAPENVKVREETLSVKGGSFTYRAEKHSVNTLIMKLK